MASHGGDAGGWGPDQGRRENAARGFAKLVHKKLEESWEIYSCYEAGASGYRLHGSVATLEERFDILS